jgi:hypothetical protein
MTMESFAALRSVLPVVLLGLGCGFLVANLRALVNFWRFRRRRASALLTWPGRRPPFYGLVLGLGVVLGLLVLFKLVVQRRPLGHVFGETMMFLYYAYAVPLSTRIARGFYRDGIWADSGFVPYGQIGGLSWREEREGVRLILIDRVRRLARSLLVPERYYGAARRLLRDQIAAHVIEFGDKPFDLGVRDERDSV